MTRRPWTPEENERLRAENKTLRNIIWEQDAHIESMQNTLAQVTAENVVLGEHVDKNIASQKEIDRLRAEVEWLRERLDDAISLAENAMRDANRDGAEYDIAAELADLRGEGE